MSETISGGLTLVIPSIGEENWGTSFKDDFATPISSHQHTGSGDGQQLVTGSIADNAITGAKLRLANNAGVRARNAANSADIEIIKLNASDQVEFGSATVSGFKLANNSFLLGRNAANSADIDLVKVDASDNVAFGANANSATTRTSLGLAIGTNVQAYSANLTTLAAGGSAARAFLGLAIGTDVQAWDAGLDAIAALAVTDSNVIVGNGTTWVAESGATARTSLGAAASGANADITSLTNISLIEDNAAMVIGTTSGSLTFKTAGTNRVVLTTDEFRPTTAGAINLGSASDYFNGLNVITIQAPTNNHLTLIAPSSGANRDINFQPGGSTQFVMGFTGRMNFLPSTAFGNGTQDPATDAPADWIECQINGTTRYIPVYS